MLRSIAGERGYKFGEYRLDGAKRVIYRGGEPQTLAAETVDASGEGPETASVYIGGSGLNKKTVSGASALPTARMQEESNF